MIYSDSENLSWWEKLSKQDKTELFGLILEKASSPSVRAFAENLVSLWERGSTLSAKETAFLRKWAR